MVSVLLMQEGLYSQKSDRALAGNPFIDLRCRSSVEVLTKYLNPLHILEEMDLNNIAALLRVKQHYKNLLVFLPLIFVSQLLNTNAFLRVFIGFIALCAISSAGYIINDIIDRNNDKNHPEKKQRPIASGKISVKTGLVTALLLFSFSVFIGIILNVFFALFIVLLFISTLFYSLFFKKIFLLDIFLISINFVIRPLSGAFIIFPDKLIRISPWLVIIPFILSLFLAAAKRRSNSLFLGKSSSDYNSLAQKYTKKTTRVIFIISTILLTLTYSIFSFTSDFPWIAVTIPIVVFAIIYFYRQVEYGSKIGRDVAYAMKDPVIIVSLILWLAVVLAVIYY